MAITLRAARDDEYADFIRDVERRFGDDLSDEELERFRPDFEFDRTVAAYDGDLRVGTGGTRSQTLTLPGAVPVPVAGVTFIGVAATHRRQGILRRMMEHLHADARDRGEMVASLLASEAPIYGRFGYGVATEFRYVEIDRRTASFRLPAPAGSIESLRPSEETGELLDRLDGARIRTTAGAMSRTAGWAQRMMIDTADTRAGAGPLEITLSRNADGEPDGIALWRLKSDWEMNRPNGTVKVLVVSATTDAARLRLHRHLVDVDLSNKVEIMNADPHDPTPLALSDARAYQTKAVGDWLWVKPLDPARCLSTRRYEAPGRLTLSVVDGDTSSTLDLNVSDDGSATCEASSNAPGLTLDVSTVGSLLLGGHLPSILASTGLIDVHDPAALAMADRVFPTRRRPFCDTHF